MSMIVDRMQMPEIIAKDACPIHTCNGVLTEIETKYLDQEMGKPVNSGRKHCSICKIEVWETETSASIERPNISAKTKGNIASTRERYQEDVLTDDSDDSQGSARHTERTKSGTKGFRARQKGINQLIVSQDILNFKRIALRGSFDDLPKGSNYTSFLFCVNEVWPNEDVDDGGVPPSFNLNGNWLPPTESAGFGQKKLGHLYSWHNGVVEKVTNYKWAKQSWQDPAGGWLVVHKCVTMFYANMFDHFSVAEGDATSYDMATADFPYNRWWPLNFYYDSSRKGLSRIDISADYQLLAGMSGTGTHFARQLGLLPYQSQTEGAPLASGLAGNLALVVGLVAFSCSFGRLHNILTENQGAWRGSRWRGHGYRDGRKPKRGMDVTIYYDPTNPQGSSRESLSELEYGGEAIL